MVWDRGPTSLFCMWISSCSRIISSLSIELLSLLGIILPDINFKRFRTIVHCLPWFKNRCIVLPSENFLLWGKKLLCSLNLTHWCSYSHLVGRFVFEMIGELGISQCEKHLPLYRSDLIWWHLIFKAQVRVWEVL